MNATLPTASLAPHVLPSFLTLPSVATECGVCVEAAARELSMNGVLPDGIVNFGARRVPIFAASRVPDIRAAIGGRAVASV